jgi:hypothetical protein
MYLVFMDWHIERGYHNAIDVSMKYWYKTFHKELVTFYAWLLFFINLIPHLHFSAYGVSQTKQSLPLHVKSRRNLIFGMI